MSAAPALAPLPTLSTETCTNTACTHANSPREMCECTACENGAGHGIAYRAQAHTGRVTVRARIARSGDVFLGAAGDTDDLVPVAAPSGRIYHLDPEDCF